MWWICDKFGRYTGPYTTKGAATTFIARTAKLKGSSVVFFPVKVDPKVVPVVPKKK